MSLYTFYPHKSDGAAAAIETFDLQSDADAPAFALKVLLDHPGCAYVAVWQDERLALSKHRLHAQVGEERDWPRGTVQVGVAVDREDGHHPG